MHHLIEVLDVGKRVTTALGIGPGTLVKKA
jgi:hypothetical protein